MSNQMEYKCPACGGVLTFDSLSQHLKCSFCNSTYNLDRLESQEPASVPKLQVWSENQASSNCNCMNWNVEPGSEWTAAETADMSVLCCSSCGGEIVCEDSTVSATCPYCGSPVVLKGKLSGMLKPDCIIPFKLDKKQAKEALKHHIAKRKLVPSLFKNENHIDEIKGVYVPFWLFDASVAANISYKGERIRTWSDADYKYIEHNYYRIYRAGYVAFDRVPVDGSEKINDDLIESIEPFDFSEAVEFKTAYLAGYMADRYDVDAKTSIKTANMRIRQSTKDAFQGTVQGFTGVTPEESFINLQNGVAKYALYPVWLLNTTWQGNMYTFAMNGQTGKFVGDLPMDKRAYWRKFAILAGVFSAAASTLVFLADYTFL